VEVAVQMAACLPLQEAVVPAVYTAVAVAVLMAEEVLAGVLAGPALSVLFGRVTREHILQQMLVDYELIH
jgi:hypothetical protein